MKRQYSASEVVSLPYPRYFAQTAALMQVQSQGAECQAAAVHWYQLSAMLFSATKKLHATATVWELHHLSHMYQ